MELKKNMAKEIKVWEKKFHSFSGNNLRIVINGASGTFIETWKQTETLTGRAKNDYVTHELTKKDLKELKDFFNSLSFKED